MFSRLPCVLIASLCTLTAGTAQAQASKAAVGVYPAKPIRLIVPFSPGGTNDVLARMIAQHLTQTRKSS